MNLVDAAVAVLDEAGAPLHVEELCRQVEQRKLVKSQKAALLRSMKGRLTSEAKKGADSKLVRVAPDTWAVRNGATAAPEEQARDKVAAPPRKARATRAKKPAARAPEAKAARPPASAKTEAAPAIEVEEASVSEPKTKLPVEELVDEAAVGELPAEPAPEVPAPAPEDPELAALYADEAETVPVAELNEYRDEQTADEDRPMLPEIVAPRRGRPGQRDRRGRDRERRKRRSREPNGHSAKEGAVEAARETTEGPSTPEVTAPPTTLEQAPAAAYLQPSPLADGAFEILLAQGDRPVQIKQLAQMMRKRNFISGDPQAMWKIIRAAIEADDETRRARGLRPRFADRGRDLYAACKLDVPAQLVRAEAAFASAAAALEQATLTAIEAKISALDAAGFERLVHLYLLRTGWQRIDWIKRAGPSSYAIADPPDRLGKMLVSARSGADPVDRRGVGELRVGVEAKSLERGLLFASTALSSVARAELSREGKPVMTVVGEEFARALCTANIGVIAAAARVPYVDTSFFENLR